MARAHKYSWSVIAMTVIAAFIAVASSTFSATPSTNHPSLAGIWFPDPARSERLPKDAPFSKEGKAVVDRYRATHDPVKDDPGAYCVPAGMPSIALGGADYPVEIIETPEQITILMELHQQVRRVFMTRKHPDDVFPQRNGHSIGHWEGDALVIDTVGIRAITFGSVPHSDQVHVTERWRRIDGGQSLVNELTIVDPKIFSKPVVLHQYFSSAGADVRMMEYECTEGRWEDHEKELQQSLNKSK